MRYIFAIMLLIATINAKILVVANKNLALSSLTQDEVRQIFLSTKPQFPDGTKAEPIEVVNSVCKAEFYKRVANKSTSQLSSYWASYMFTGKGRPPKQIDTIENLTVELKNNGSAITYICEKNMLDKELKILLEVDE